MKRVAKYKTKYKVFIISLQMLVLWYSILYGVQQLNSYTNASFNDVEQAGVHIKWEIWDKSSLSFNGQESGGQCGNVYADIKRGNVLVTDSVWQFELFEVSKAKTPIGAPIDTGEVPKGEINQNGVARLISNKVTENGSYQFRVTRPPGHKAKNQPDEEGATHIWNEGLIIIEDCNEGTEQPATEQQTDSTIKNTEQLESEKPGQETEGAITETDLEKEESEETPEISTNTSAEQAPATEEEVQAETTQEDGTESSETIEENEAVEPPVTQEKDTNDNERDE
ncbi:hypothetical protein ACQCVK_09625 [Rossellomorea vietnamensis]|uniref:hypothetical protein n=1 Tax=Rossellomorea vietnamensis TaxID=218284 RepID=UPI003CE9C017